MAAIPKPASTVVLVDENLKVYLTKRPATMKFMAGFHVFPGGVVEGSDDELILDHVKQLDLPLRYYVAAARELFEEVGILLAKKLDGSPAELSTDKLEDYRRQLIEGKISFDRFLNKEGLTFDLASLSYIGQVITPSFVKTRFDTRFFLAKLPHGQTPEPDGLEVEAALWITPEEALAEYEAKKMKLAPPTIITLQSLISYKNGGALELSVTESDLLELLKMQRANNMAP